MENLIVIAGSFVLSIGAVSVTLGKVLPKVTKYIHIAKEAIDLLDDVTAAVKDNTITKEEVDEIMKEVSELKLALKA